MHAFAQPCRVRDLVEMRPKLAVTDDREMHARVALGQPRRGREEDIVRLDRDEPTHDAYHRRVGGDAEVGAQPAAPSVHHVVEIQAESDHGHLSPADAKAVEVGRNLRADGDETRRHAPQCTLDQKEERGRHAAEVAVEDVPVKRVHDDRHARQPCGRASQRPGFRGVSRDDDRPLAAEVPVKPHDRADVGERVQGASQSGHVDHPGAGGHRLALQRALTLGGLPRQQHCVELRRRVRRQDRHVSRGTADVHAGDDPGELRRSGSRQKPSAVPPRS